MSQNKSKRTKCGKKIKIQVPQNRFCVFKTLELDIFSLDINQERTNEIIIAIVTLNPTILSEITKNK